MSALPRRRYGILAWGAGASVLLALAVTLKWMGRSVGDAPQQPRALDVLAGTHLAGQREEEHLAEARPLVAEEVAER